MDFSFHGGWQLAAHNLRNPDTVAAVFPRYEGLGMGTVRTLIMQLLVCVAYSFNYS